MPKKTYSFDIFDTVLTRIWARPTDLFIHVASELSIKGLISKNPEQWKIARINTEKELRKSQCEEIKISSIYNILASRFGWSSVETEEALSIEIATEQTAWHIVPSIYEHIQEIHSSGENIIFLSDMYLPDTVIRSFLKNKNVWKEGDILHVSSSNGLSKQTGTLFDFCLEQQNICAHQLHHIGDNPISDVRIPKELGINASRFTDTYLTRYEQAISEYTALPLTLRSLLAGSCRLSRLKSPYTDTDLHRQVIWNTASDVMGPVLFSFVHWCLVEAQRKEIKRLYFVARDGQILHKIALSICKNWGYTIDCRYLYGSRQAIKFPSIKTLGEYELNWIFQYKEGFLSVSSICERVNISPSQIKKSLTKNNFLQKNWTKELSLSERDRLKEIFRTEKEINDLIVLTAYNYREAAIGYFAQEGMLENISFGFVDLGWTGSVLKALNDLLSSANVQTKKDIQGFYFALKQRVNLPPNSLSAYYFDNLKPNIKRLMVCQCSELFEALVAADHGSTVKYEKANEKYIPVLRNHENKETLEWGIHSYQEAITLFTNIFSSNLEKSLFITDHSEEICNILLKIFVNTPSRLEAEVFGKLQHSQDMVEAEFFYLAPEFSVSDFLHFLFKGDPFPSYLWIPAVFAQSNRYSSLPFFLLFNFFQSLKLIKLKLLSLIR